MSVKYCEGLFQLKGEDGTISQIVALVIVSSYFSKKNDLKKMLRSELENKKLPCIEDVC